MITVFLAIGGLAVIVLAINWFMRAQPSRLARTARRWSLGLGVVVLFLLAAFLIRFFPGILPEMLGLAGLVATALIPRLLRRRMAAPGGFSSPGSMPRTEVRTAFLRAWIDHATGDVGGAVLAGRFAGRTLDNLTDAELVELHGEASGDMDSARVLEAYIDRRLGTGWRSAQRSGPSSSRGDMTREEALALLGLAEGATPEEIRSAHRRLIQRVHPDAGGSADLAARINRARDVLLG